MATETRKLAEERVGTLLAGKWFLDALLGYGGSAAVYAATHRNGKRAAVKVLHPHCVRDEQLRTRFVREGYVANKIGHPGAVSVLDDDTSPDGTPYLVMELLEGTSLERLGRGELPPMTLAEVIRIADDLLDVLAKAHAVGVVHRDIKPANLFMTTEGQLKVLDFGIARLAAGPRETDGGTTQTGLMMGTPAFMPPEQARARWSEVDQRSDLWAVGATMIALLLGRRPRIADTSNEELLLAMTAPMPTLASLVPMAPVALGAVIDKAVSFNREDRFPDARTMQEALRKAASSIEMSSMSETLVERANATGRPPPPTEPFVPAVNTTVVAPHFSHAGHAGGPYANMVGAGGVVGMSSSSSPASTTGPSLPDPPPSLTTSRAVLHSSPPSIVAKKKVAVSRFLLGAITFAALSMIGIALGYMRMHGRIITEPPPATTAAAAATTTTDTTPAVEPAPTPSTVIATAAPSASASSVVSSTKTTKPAAAAAAPRASANPAKYFDSRF